MGGEDVARRGDSARIQGMVRSIDQYRNGQPKAVADGSYAQVLYALTDYKHDVLVLWDFAVATARKAEALQREIAELRKKLDACDWYWPEDDTSSDACADGPLQIAENCDLPPGEVLAYSRGGVVETRFYAYLPPADDSDSDDEFEVDAETELAVKQAIEAETARRARALMKGEDDAGN